jgi:hypothetical protein
MTVAERARKRQASRISNLKEGDANTRYFHTQVNSRRRNFCIHRLKHNNGWIVNHQHKKTIIQNHFGAQRNSNINWSNIPVPDCDLDDIAGDFSEEEVKGAIFGSASEKALGLDGFTGAFYKACWDIVKPEIMHVIHSFHTLRIAHLHWINSANIALIPKKDGAEDISDYRPISLIHAIAKYIAKMMAARLTPHMESLVSNAQSAFIKKI